MDKEKTTEAVINAKVLRLRYTDKYGNSISESTWNRWLNKNKSLREIVPPHTKTYTPKQVKAIYEAFGEP